jgi:hypothetical protein
MKIRKDELLGRLPPEWPVSLLPQIQELVTRSGIKIVVLDDDPTGTQTVHHVPVLTGSARLHSDQLAQLSADTGKGN